jgi:dipeptidyl aminopeptidase/acylaminoacyl peptidase
MTKHIVATALLAFTFSLSAQKAPMSPERLWELGRVGLETTDAKGKQFVYGVTRYDIDENKGERDLYLMSADGKKETQLTDMEGGEYGAHFLMDDKKIGFSKGGDFHLIDLNGENLTTITNFGNMGNVNAYDLPDGRIALLFTRPVKLESTTADLYPEYPQANARVIDDLMYRHWDNWSDAEYNHVFIAYYDPSTAKKVVEAQDLMLNEKFDSPLNPFGGSESFTLSPDGKTVVYEAKKKSGREWAVSTNSELYMVNLTNKKTTNITKGMMGYDKEPKFSPDGSKLAWLSMATEGYESDVNDLVVMDVATGAKMHVLKTAGSYDDITFQSYAWNDNRSFYVGVPENGTNQIYSLKIPKNIEGNTGKISMQPASDGIYNWNHFEVAGKQLMVARQDMNHATEVYALNPKKKSFIQLTHINDGVYQNTQMSKVEKHMMKTSDGKDMLTWIIYPPDFDPNKKYPTLLYCQGGPQSQVSQFYSFRWNFQLMAAKGYVVIAPNRRGLPGFGREWNEEISGDWGGQPMRDYLAAIDYATEKPWCDAENLGCVGASYGGYSVYMLAGIHENRFDAFISHCGLFDLESWYLSTEELFFANYDLGGPYWDPQNKDTYTKYDPKDYVQNWNTPMLVIHGGKDFRVPENQGMEAFQAAKLRGVPSKFLYFPEEGHWILSPQNGLIWHDQFFGWLDEWLKDKN